MSKLTLKQQLTQLRAQHAELLQQRQAESRERKIRQAEYMSIRADHLMIDIYDELSKQVYSSGGLGESTVLRIISNYISSSDGTKDVAAVRKLVKDRSGIEVVAEFPDATDNEQRYWVRVNLQSEVKAYSLPAESETPLRKARTLDFPALFTENTRRNQLWQKDLRSIAQKAVDTCRHCLENLDTLYYGLNRETTLLMQGYSALNGCWQLGEQKLPYGALTESQIADLAKAMNALISGGEVKLWLARTSHNPVLNASLTRQPHKMIEGAYFDYEEFCKPYDHVTEPLQMVFDQIIQGLEPKDVGAQLALLKPDRKLTYYFDYRSISDPLNYARVKRGLEGHQHQYSFVTTVNQALPAIRVISVAFITNNTACHVGKLELTYDIVDEEAEFVQKQIATEKAIKHIKQHSSRRFARIIVDTIMNDIEKSNLSHLFKANYPERSCYEIQKAKTTVNVAMPEGPEEYEITPSQIQDEEFITRVELSVNRLTDGLILVDIRHSRYKLNFSEAVACAIKPLTLNGYNDLIWSQHP